MRGKGKRGIGTDVEVKERDGHNEREGKERDRH